MTTTPPLFLRRSCKSLVGLFLVTTAASAALSLVSSARGQPSVAASSVNLQVSKQRLDQLSQRAIAELQAGNPRAARPLAESAVRLSTRQFGKESRDTAHHRTVLCKVYMELCDWRRALDCAEQVREIRRKIDGPADTGYIVATNTLGVIHQKLGNLDRAEKLHREAMAIVEQMDKEGRQSLAYASCWNHLAVVFLAREQYDSALEFLEQARRIAERAQNGDALLTQILLHEASCQYKRAHYDAAKETIARARQILAQNGARQGETHIAALTVDGAISLDLADYDRAMQCFEAAEQIAAKLDKNHPLRASALNHIALVQQAKGLYHAADRSLEQAGAIVEMRLGEGHNHYADILQNRAYGRKLMGDFAKAEELYTKVNDIYRAGLGEHHSHYLKGLNNLAMLYVAQERYPEAEEMFKSARSLLAQAPSKQILLQCTFEHNLGLVKLAAGEIDAARSAFEEAAAVIEQRLGKQQPNFAMSLHNWALAELRRGHPERADALFQQSADIRRELQGNDHPEFARTLAEWALAKQALDEPSAAWQLANDAVRSIRRHIDLIAAGQSERQQLAAVPTYRRILDCYMSLPGDSSGPSHQALYDALLDWKGVVTRRQRLIRQIRSAAENPASGKRVAELQQATQQLADSVWDDEDGRRTRQSIQSLVERVEGLQRELASVMGPATASRHDAGWCEVFRALPAGVSLVDFFVIEDATTRPGGTNRPERRIEAFVVRSGGQMIRVPLGPAEPIEAAAREFRQANANARQAGAALRNLVWAPLVPHIGENDTVLISPDGALTSVPWSALPINANGDLLIEKHPMAICPVPQLLSEMLAAPAPPSEPSLLLLGDVEYGKPATREHAANGRESSSMFPKKRNWLPLPGTGREIAAIRSTFQKTHANGEITMLIGRSANETELRRQATRHEFLHLATHGFFAAENIPSAMNVHASAAAGWNNGAMDVFALHPGLLSGIVLAGANEPPAEIDNNGILTALELAELDLRGVSLATLSACETGRGQVAGGEGLLGLQRALQTAGVRSTITSLWQVPDDATQIMMGRFYENLWAKGLPRLEALREAQLWMLHGQPDHHAELEQADAARKNTLRGIDLPEASGGRSRSTNPFFWAGFVLSGDWR